jgi:hypothetical protein
VPDERSGWRYSIERSNAVVITGNRLAVDASQGLDDPGKPG